MAERVYTTGEVGKLLGATPALLRDWVQRGWLAVDRLPDGSVHVTETALIQFLHRCGVNIEDVMARTVTRQARSAAPAATPAAETLDVTFSPAAPEVQAAPTADAAAPTPQRAPAAHEDPEAPAPSLADQAVANAARAAPVRAARQVLEAILQDAAQRRAAAVHLEWQADGLTLRLRIDGRLHEKPSFKARLPKPLGPTLVAECKALAALNPSETGRSQGGGGVRHLLGRDFDLRISTCPTVHGENVVVRLRDRAARPLSLQELGLAEGQFEALREILTASSGLVVVSAVPRENGDRTLRAMAAAGAAPERRVLRIGFPSEDAMPGVVQAAPGQGFSTGAAILAAMDQDVDVIEVADMGDRETVQAATAAAAAGHLVLAGHRSRWPSTDPTVLISSGAAPSALAAVLLAVVAQKRVRRICYHCKTAVPPDAELLARLAFQEGAEISAASVGLGCDRCGHTGYLGEGDLYAVLAVDEEISRLIGARADGRALVEAARRLGGGTLREAALESVRAGLTSLDEAARALGL